jgi:hypothetical protein
MFKFEELQQGIPVKDLLPNYKNHLADLDAQVRKYQEQEIEAGLGPEPTRSNMTASESEMFKIKQMSRYSYGATTVRELNKGMNVLSIIDVETGKEAEEYNSIWLANQMGRKMEIFKPDYRIGGTGFLEASVENGIPVINVKSPKKVSSFSSDPVNNIWADFAVERFSNSGVNYFRYYDSTMILTFKQVKDGWELEEWEEHKLGKCPILPIHNNMTSDGVVTGDLELVKPNFDTLRQRTNSTSQATYWSGTKTIILKGIDPDDNRPDLSSPNPDATYNVLDRAIQEIRMTDGGLVVLPGGGDIGTSPELSQTQESNLTQLVEAKKDALRDIAAITGLPYSVFDPSAVPTTTEASVQAYMSTNDNKDLDKINIGNSLEMLISQMVFAITGEWKQFKVIWDVSEQVSINSIADTVSKLSTSGLPLPWIVQNVLRGYRPNQINELLDMLELKDQLAREQGQFLMGGL